TDDLGIPINHYVELKFDGLQNVVNALGGISEDFPERVYDLESGLNIQTTGCVHLNGSQALALVRARHLQYDPPGNASPVTGWPYDPESDLSRIVRDHVFLRVLATTAISQGLTDPLKLNAFLGAIINQLIMDPGLKNEMVKVAAHYRHVNPNTVPEMTLPITTVGNYHYGGYDIGDVDFPVEPADDQVIAQWDGQALPAPAAPTVVKVFNLAGTYNLAANTAASLNADGVKATVGGDSPVPGTPTETLVQYTPASLAQAVAVARHLAGAVMLQTDSSLPAGTINLQAGSLLSVTPPGAATTPAATAAPANSAAPPTTAAAAPTFNGQKPSASTDQIQPWDPTACPAK
ncbi:MAG: LCP family protein, partial [Acidimicrobiales bacterium]|nr:LCP family protein [Acidimicrobiales bacterium]